MDHSEQGPPGHQSEGSRGGGALGERPRLFAAHSKNIYASGDASGLHIRTPVYLSKSISRDRLLPANQEDTSDTHYGK